MFSSLAILLAIGAVSQVQGQSLYACDTLKQPDWESCARVTASIPWDENAGTGGGAEPIPDGQCRYFLEPGNVGNCVISACNIRGDGNGNYLFGYQVHYRLVEEWCADAAGGRSPGADADEIRYVDVTNNPDFSPSAAKRSAVGKLDYKTVTLAEMEAFNERAKQVNVERLAPVSKRQEVTYTLYGVARNSRYNNERTRLSAIAGSGSQQQWSTTEGYSNSVTTSAEVGVNLFEIFTASVSISVTQEFSVSHTETIVFDPSGRCEPAQSAVLYYYPLYDVYAGKFSDQENEVEIAIPVEGANNFMIDVECLG